MPEKAAMPELTRWTSWRTRRQGRVLVVALLLAGTVWLSLSLRSSLIRSAQAPGPVATRAVKALPPDVESVLKSFSYSQTDAGEKVTISGKSVIRRGRRVLGLRSNLVKTNFISELKGSFRSPKGATSFAASVAEWDAEAAHPLLLNKNVSVTVNGKPLAGVVNARNYLKRGVLEVNDGSKSYLLR